MIQLKTAAGVIQQLTPHAFEKHFGVKYEAHLVIDKNCPPAEWTQAHSAPRKIPSESRRRFFEKQVVKIKDLGAWSAGSMKTWLYAEQIRAAYTANVYIAKVSDVVGYGAFAGEDIEIGQMIGEYTGFARAWRKSDSTNTYLFHYVKDAVIDARKRGNFSRFINHSAKNANARYMRVMVDDVEHTILLAEKDIRKDEQILFNYGEEYWLNRQAPEDLI
jgi:SET domain-containing protein